METLTEYEEARPDLDVLQRALSRAGDYKQGIVRINVTRDDFKNIRIWIEEDLALEITADSLGRVDIQTFMGNGNFTLNGRL